MRSKLGELGIWVGLALVVVMIVGCSSEESTDERNGADADFIESNESNNESSSEADPLEYDGSDKLTEESDSESVQTDSEPEPYQEAEQEDNLTEQEQTELDVDEPEPEPESLESDPELECESPTRWWRDSDGDGFGDPNDSRIACEKPEGYVDNPNDCDDTKADVFPNSHATEVPNDGIDQNCDGLDACTDLNCDGFPDIVFAQTDNDGEYHFVSYIYFGSETGYSESNRAEVPTVGAMGVAAGDLNNDGYIDLVFAAVQDGTTRELNSLVYYGNGNGVDTTQKVELPTIGCADPTIADLNGDGWLDIIFANRYKGAASGGGMPNPNDYKISSYIYWGSEQGFSVQNRLELPTIGAARSRVADLNRDGYLDVVFANGVMQLIAQESYIYWGSANGWNEQNRTSLETQFPEGVEVFDLNEDGYLDILFTSWMCLFCEGNYIYWGAEDGTYSADRRTTINGAVGATDVKVADLNKDGFFDLVFANGAVDMMTQEFAQESYVYWGSDDGYSEENRLALPAVAASECAVADLNEDGWLDIVFSSHYPPQEGAPEVSQIYWGSQDGFSAERVTLLPTKHAAGVKVVGAK